MARIPYDEHLIVLFVEDIADPSAPTVAELAAGVDLSHYVPKDGFDPGIADNQIPTGAIDTTFDAEVQGSYGSKLKIDFMRDDNTDVAWETLPRNTIGYIVDRPVLHQSVPIAAGQLVNVKPVESGSRMPQKSATNTMQRFSVAFAVTDTPFEDAVVAA